MYKSSSLLHRIFRCQLKYAAWYLIGLWCISLFCKLLAWYIEPAVGRDASFYLLTVQQWYDTGTYPISWIPPMLYALVRGVMFCGFGVEAAGLIVNIGMGSAIVFICYGIAFEATQDKRIALISALFATFHPGINDLSIEIQRDIPYLFLSGIAVWCAVAAFKRKKWYLWSGAGAALALSFLTRYETAEFLLLFPIIIIVQLIFHKISWKKAILFLSSLIFSAVITFFVFLYLSGNQKFLLKYEKYYSQKFNTVKNSFDKQEK